MSDVKVPVARGSIRLWVAGEMAPIARKPAQTCPTCAAYTRGVVTQRHGLLCGICGEPLRRERKEKQRKEKKQPVERKPTPQDRLSEMERRDFEQYKRELRRRERQQQDAPDPDEEFSTLLGQWRRSDAGYPLGVHMPPGASLRQDGQSHRHAWMEILRTDPCSYCGKREAGTVDHIVPKSKARPSEGHNWLNYAAACESCNGAKRDTPLLLFLWQRVPRSRRARQRAA